ncbi:MAG TPA: hypothetical protein VFT98_13455 [Myxococcota bacterium]|nr:hypothetical protein [Myxococcota bacterium]
MATHAAPLGRFLFVDQSLVPFGINFVLNGAIAYAINRNASSIPFAGQASIVGDTVITSFLLPFLTCLIVTGLIHKQIAGGKLAALSSAPGSGAFGFLAARGKALRGALLGVAAVALVAAPTLLALGALGVDELARDAFLFFKAGYAGALAAIVQPIIAWVALAPRAA